MKILIVGGGVAGTALASFMQDDAEITLIDHAPKWGNIGYAIGLWGNGRKVLRELGVEDQVIKNSYEIPWEDMKDQRGSSLKRFRLRIFRPYGATLVVTRTALHRALIASLGAKVNVRLKLTVNEIVQDETGATVVLSDGSTERFDLIVGADGINSKVRELVFGQGYLKSYGWSIYAFWAPRGQELPQGAVALAGGGQICVIYPLQKQAVVALVINEADDPPGMAQHPRARLLKLFAGFDPAIDRMVEAIEDPEHIFHDNVAHIDMKEWYRGRVVLMGDAQHAASPVTAMGASMALEDAYVLAAELKKIKGLGDIPTALQAYVARRDRRVRQFRRASALIEHWLGVRSPVLSVLRDVAVRLLPARFFTDPIEKLLKEEP
jgi:2-polyprenyl-6-methoxyphenol hydroxylase-like FAD-dependent oxidoreductase